MIKQKKRKLTVEESIILDCWYQYAYRYKSKNKEGMWAGGAGSLILCEAYLRQHKIINSWGNVKKEIEW